MGKGKKHKEYTERKDSLLKLGIVQFLFGFPDAEIPADQQQDQQHASKNGQLESRKHRTQVFTGFFYIGCQNGQKGNIIEKTVVFHKVSNIYQGTELQEESKAKSRSLLDPEQYPVFVLVDQQEFQYQQDQEEHDAASVVADIKVGEDSDVVGSMGQTDVDIAVASQPNGHG
nr:hypothetical protein [Acidaminococcus fermentans]